MGYLSDGYYPLEDPEAPGDDAGTFFALNGKERIERWQKQDRRAKSGRKGEFARAEYKQNVVFDVPAGAVATLPSVLFAVLAGTEWLLPILTLDGVFGDPSSAWTSASSSNSSPAWSGW